MGKPRKPGRNSAPFKMETAASGADTDAMKRAAAILIVGGHGDVSIIGLSAF
jgi:hypothetical protein